MEIQHGEDVELEGSSGFAKRHGLFRFWGDRRRVWGRNIIQFENECILRDGFNNKIISYSENVLNLFLCEKLAN